MAFHVKISNSNKTFTLSSERITTMYQPTRASLGELLKRVHQDERGAVSIETILVVAAIAVPVLIFVLKVGWPMIRDKIFHKGMEDLMGGIENVNGSGTSTGSTTGG
jgi:ABC-type microcin C transport system permease subunit YejE|tara:strand:- start:178 stop:498 length:321 start_codon:yes stop_codon:yes gene_type:complete